MPLGHGAEGSLGSKGVKRFGNISDCRYESEWLTLAGGVVQNNQLCTLRGLLFVSEKNLEVNFASHTE